MTTHRRPHPLEVLYLLVVVALPVGGAIAGHPAPYLAALVLTLPCGIVAFPAIYAGYAAFEGVGGLVGAATLPNGDDAMWLTLSSQTLDVALFAAAAIGNVVLLRTILAARRSRTTR